LEGRAPFVVGFPVDKDSLLVLLVSLLAMRLEPAAVKRAYFERLVHKLSMSEEYEEFEEWEGTEDS
jgi:hypothetical protein